MRLRFIFFGVSLFVILFASSRDSEIDKDKVNKKEIQQSKKRPSTKLGL